MNYLLAVPMLASFFVTLFLIPAWIKKAFKIGLAGKDIHKNSDYKIPESGGIVVVAGFILGILVYIAINTFVFQSTINLIEIFALINVILLVSFVAFIDDILYLAGWKQGLRRRTRLILVALAAVPLIAINAGRSGVFIPFFGSVDIGLIYPLVIIPIGIIGATTVFNFVEGFNGLGSGQGVIILSAVALVSYFTGSVWLSVIALSMIASLLAFMIFNFYPAKVFPGDSLTYPVGGLIAIISILGNFERIAVFFFIPYAIEALLKIRGGLTKQSYCELNKKGGLDLRYKKLYSLTHISILLIKKAGFEATEKRAVYLIWAFQIFIVILGFVLFRGGIFS